MKTTWWLACGVVVGACGEPDELVDGLFTSDDWTKVETLSPLPEPPADPTNAYADNPAAATLGQRLFFERAFSGPLLVGSDGQNGGLGAAGESGKVACASCHMPSGWFSDVRSNPANVSLAADWTTRNTPPLVNATFYKWFFWDGRKDSMWSQALGPSEAPGEMASSRLAIAHVIWTKYAADYNALFSPPLDAALDPASPGAARFPAAGKPGDTAWDSMTPADQQIINTIFANYGKALEAYERLLVSRNSPFDRYVAGDDAAISTPAKRGLRQFIGNAGCIDCHSTPLMSDNEFHSTGVVQVGPHVPTDDTGRFDAIPELLADPFNSGGAFSDDRSVDRTAGLVQSVADEGLFRTKDLRQVAETGPYMHDGCFATLEEVIEHYRIGGADIGFAGEKDPRITPLALTARDAADLAEFMRALTGDPVPAALLVDTSR